MRHRCARCEAIKYESEFYVSKTSFSGVQSWCKECMCGAAAEWAYDHTDPSPKLQVLPAWGGAEMTFIESTTGVEGDAAQG